MFGHHVLCAPLPVDGEVHRKTGSAEELLEGVRQGREELHYERGVLGVPQLGLVGAHLLDWRALPSRVCAMTFGGPGPVADHMMATSRVAPEAVGPCADCCEGPAREVAITGVGPRMCGHTCGNSHKGALQAYSIVCVRPSLPMCSACLSACVHASGLHMVVMYPAWLKTLIGPSCRTCWRL